MNTSGEAADQVVRMSLEVGEAALKITGAGAKPGQNSLRSFCMRY